jgi:hypothetical protein
MGLIAQCDGGCGYTTDDVSKFKEFGIVKKVWYCEKCAGSMQALYDQRDTLHTLRAGQLKSDLLNAVATFKSVSPTARLPDAPE